MDLFFDSETTGMLAKGMPAGSPAHPHICQLGAQLCDENRRVVAEINLLVKPDRWSIPAEAEAIHGISTAMCEKYGLPIKTVATLFIRLAQRAKRGIAHNHPFDKMMVWTELIRSQAGAELAYFLEFPEFCTMAASTPILKLPGRYGDFKWPNLQEAHKFFLHSRFEGAHDAMADVNACRRVYYAIMDAAKPAAPAPQPALEEV